MGTIAGVRGTGNILAAKRVIDISKKVSVLEPDAAPLTQLTKKLDKRVAINPKYNWLEEESLNKVDAVNHATQYTSGATVIAVDDGDKFRAGDVVKDVNTGEQMVVSSVSSDDVTFKRGFGTTTAAAISDDDVLFIVGNTNQEGASKRDFLTGQEVEKTNYLQIFRTPFGVTRTADNSEMYTGKDLAHVRMMQLIEHQKEIERAFLWGEPFEDTTGTHPKRTTGGLNYWISTNVTNDSNGTLTETEFEAFIRTGFRYGSKTKYFLGAPIYVSAISAWAGGKLQTLPKDKTYGISITQYLSPHGVVNIINCNLFSEVTTYAGYGFLMDLESVAYRFLANSDTKLKTHIEDNSADGEEDEYLSEVGFELQGEKKNSKITAVTSFS